MQKYLPTLGIQVAEGRFSPIVETYIVSVLTPSCGRELGMRSLRELKTLGSAVDLLVHGYVPEALDLLMMRFQAVESSPALGWATAQHLEGIPEVGVSSLSLSERRRAAHVEARESKTRSLLTKMRG